MIRTDCGWGPPRASTSIEAKVLGFSRCFKDFCGKLHVFVGRGSMEVVYALEGMGMGAMRPCRWCRATRLTSATLKLGVLL